MNLFLQSLTKFLLGVVILGLLIFLPAGSFHYWQGWLLMGILFVPMLIAGLVMMAKNPELLRKRLNAKEQEKEQKTVVALSGLLFIAAFVVAGLNWRFQWCVLPNWAVWVAAVLFLVCYALYAEVLRENTYLSRTIEVQEHQKVVDTGLYGVVRHPMYMATTILFLMMPLVLASPFSFGIMLLYIPLIAKRIRNEEAVLEQGLEGYSEYKQRVKYKIIPLHLVKPPFLNHRQATAPMPNDPATLTIWQDSVRKLFVADGVPTLIYKGKTYTFACQPYEPMAIIKLDGKPVAYLHNAFNPEDECQMFITNQKYLVRTISGRHHDAERFCRLLCTAVEYGYDRDVDEAEDKMQELLVQEKGVKTIQFETRDFHCDKVLYEGIYVLLGHFENTLSKANNIGKIYSIAFGYLDRNTDYYEYFFLTELQYRRFKELPEKNHWKQKDDAWEWKSQNLEGRQVLCNEFSQNPTNHKPYFRLDEIPQSDEIHIEYKRDSVCAADDYINRTLKIVLPIDAVMGDLVYYIQHYNDDYGYSGIPYTGGVSWWALKSNKGILAYVNDGHNEVRYSKYDSDTPLKDLDIKEVYGTRNF